MRLPGCWKLSNECRESARRIGRSQDFSVQVAELKTNTRQLLLVRQEMVKQLLPIGNLAVFQHELQGDIFEEQVFGRTRESISNRSACSAREWLSGKLLMKKLPCGKLFAYIHRFGVDRCD